MYRKKVFAALLIIWISIPVFGGCTDSAKAPRPVPGDIEPEINYDGHGRDAAAGDAGAVAGENAPAGTPNGTVGRDDVNGAGGRDDMNGTVGRDDVNGAGGRDDMNGTVGRNDVNGADSGDGMNDTSVTNQDETVSDPGMVTITISAAGDVSLGNYLGQDYEWSFDEMYDKAEDEGYFFENVREIFSGDDMTILNLEGVLTLSEEPAPDRTYNMRGDPKYASILTLGGVEAVSMANNHRQDFGEAGTRDTRAALEAEGIVYAYEKNLGIYETKGIRIGFVSVNETSWGKGVERLMKDGIKKLQEDGADLILACCHWGTEKEFYAGEYQREFGRMCIDWGADLVIGHHPHVLQGVEEYKGKYIVYSLANFCFGGNRNPADKDTMIVQQTFTFADGVKQEKTVFRIIPCSVSSVTNRNDYRPTPVTGDAAQRIIDRINEYSAEFGTEFDKSGYPVVG